MRLLVASYDPEDRTTSGLLTIVEADADGLRVRAGRELPRASYLARRSADEAYVVQELPESRLALVRIDGDGIEVLDERPTLGAQACHVALHPAGRLLGVAHYGSGSAAFQPVDEGGRFAGEPTLLEFSGAGPDPDRQEAPHAHQVVFADDGRIALVSDLGTDRIHVLAVDGTHVEQVGEHMLPPGSGPRHLVLTERFLAVAGELDGAVHWAPRDRPEEWRSTPVGASLSAFRAWRGPDEVVVASRGTGRLTALRLGDESAATLMGGPAGRSARDLVVTDAGVLVADQAGGELLELDDTGAVTARLELPAPASILPLG